MSSAFFIKLDRLADFVREFPALGTAGLQDKVPFVMGSDKREIRAFRWTMNLRPLLLDLCELGN
jgi:hypothetical protein